MTALPTMHGVESSNIDAIGHDGDHLFIRFKSGGVHRFHDVPAETFESMKSADSVGKFFHATIKGKHVSNKMEDA